MALRWNLANTIMIISWHRLFSGKSYCLCVVSKERLQPTEYSPANTKGTFQAQYQSLMINSVKSCTEMNIISKVTIPVSAAS